MIAGEDSRRETTTFIYMDSNIDDDRQWRSPDDDRRTQTTAFYWKFV